MSKSREYAEDYLDARIAFHSTDDRSAQKIAAINSDRILANALRNGVRVDYLPLEVEAIRIGNEIYEARRALLGEEVSA